MDDARRALALYKHMRLFLPTITGGRGEKMCKIDIRLLKIQLPTQLFVTLNGFDISNVLPDA